MPKNIAKLCEIHPLFNAQKSKERILAKLNIAIK